MATSHAILESIRSTIDLNDYRKLHWEGTFDDYLNVILDKPGVTRTAYQRLYDMILGHGTEDVYENKEKLTRFKFFTEFATKHGDGIYGLDRPLMQLVNTFKSSSLPEAVSGGVCAQIIEARLASGTAWTNVTSTSAACSMLAAQLLPGGTLNISAIGDQAKIRTVAGSSSSVVLRARHTLAGASTSYTLQSNEITFQLP